MQKFRLPSPAMVVACVALAVALSGASYAAIVLPRNSVGAKQLKKGAVTTKKIRNNAVTGSKVKEVTLGQVPSAANAADANALGGIAPSGYVRTPTEATRLVGTPGNPAFQDGYTNLNFGAPAGFFKDQFGIVHLQGDVNPPGFSSTIFTLPPGYRPSHGGAVGPMFLVSADTGTGVVEVMGTGEVRDLSSHNNNLSLNGLTFRAAD
jgi:hypothetical protein